VKVTSLQVPRVDVRSILRNMPCGQVEVVVFVRLCRTIASLLLHQ